MATSYKGLDITNGTLLTWWTMRVVCQHSSGEGAGCSHGESKYAQVQLLALLDSFVQVVSSWAKELLIICTQFS